jgi:hypothetical protein
MRDFPWIWAVCLSASIALYPWWSTAYPYPTDLISLGGLAAIGPLGLLLRRLRTPAAPRRRARISLRMPAPPRRRQLRHTPLGRRLKLTLFSRRLSHCILDKIVANSSSDDGMRLVTAAASLSRTLALAPFSLKMGARWTPFFFMVRENSADHFHNRSNRRPDTLV